MTRTRLALTIRVAASLAFAGAPCACTNAPVPVRVQVTVDGVPVPGLDVTAYPFDPTGLLDSLATAYGEPPPDVSALEEELRAFSPPEPAPDDAAGVVWAATRDSVAALADSLNAVDRRAPGYGDAYGRFRRLYGRLVERTAARDRAGRQATEPLRDLALRAGRAADSLRAWELAAYAGFDSAAAGEIRATGRQPIAGVTDPQGWLELALVPGRWTLTTELPHPENPFLELRWVVPVTVSVFPFRVPMTERMAQEPWRH